MEVNVIHFQTNHLEFQANSLNTVFNHFTATDAVIPLNRVRDADENSYLLNITPEQALIKELLAVKGYNLTRIALELNISKASVSRMLNGIIRQTSGKTFTKLLALYCSVFHGGKKIIFKVKNRSFNNLLE